MNEAALLALISAAYADVKQRLRAKTGAQSIDG